LFYWPCGPIIYLFIYLFSNSFQIYFSFLLFHFGPKNIP